MPSSGATVFYSVHTLRQSDCHIGKETIFGVDCTARNCAVQVVKQFTLLQLTLLIVTIVNYQSAILEIRFEVDARSLSSLSVFTVSQLARYEIAKSTPFRQAHNRQILTRRILQ